MKKLIFTITILVSLISIQARTNLNTLWAIFNDESQTKDDRIYALLSLAKAYKIINTDSSVILYDIGIQFANDIEDDTIKANVFKVKGKHFYNHGLFKETIQNYDSALYYYIKLDMPFKQAGIYIKTALSYRENGDSKRSKELLNRALNIFTQLKDFEGIAAVYNNMSTLERYKGNYVKAIKLQFDAHKIHIESGNERLIACLID